MIKISLIFALFCFSFHLFAQQSLSLISPDEKIAFGAVREYQEKYLVRLYWDKVGDVDELVNGKDYIPYYQTSRLKPLLFFDRDHSTSIILNGREHSGVALDYDTYLDELIYSDSARVVNFRLTKIALNKETVESFTFYSAADTLLFRYFRPGQRGSLNLADGFYEVGYEGKSEYIIKHRSLLLVKEGLTDYIYTPVRYIKTGGQFIKIKSSADFIRIFGDKASEVKKYMRASRFKYRNAGTKQIGNILKYYDSLLAAKGIIK